MVYMCTNCLAVEDSRECGFDPGSENSEEEMAVHQDLTEHPQTEQPCGL